MEERTDKVCKIAGCGRATLAHGLCATHCKRVERHGDPRADEPIAAHGGGSPICKTPDCGKPVSVQRENYVERGAQGYCRSCYRTMRGKSRRRATAVRREYVFA